MEQPTLADVQTWFAAWRSQKQHREPIPEKLWDAAVSLTSRHSICQISKALRLCYTKLKKRVGDADTVTSGPAMPAFIEVDLKSAVPTECCIEMEHHNGNKLSMHFKGKAGLDLQSLTESFWSKDR